MQIEMLELSIFDRLREWATSTPEAIALLDRNRQTITYSRLYNNIHKFRETLAAAGTSGHRVAVWFENPSEMLIAIIAVSAIATCVPLPSGIPYSEAKQLFKNLDIRILFSNAAVGSPLERVARDLEMSVFRTSRHGDCPDRWLDLTPVGEFDIEPALSSTGNDIALIVQTSGSSGRPKFVPITHKAITAHCHGSANSLALVQTDRCLTFMPLNHIHGLISGAFLPLFVGSSCVLVGPFNRQLFVGWLVEFSPSWLSTSPAIYLDILQELSHRERSLDGHSLRFIRSGSSHLPIALARKLERTFGVPLVEAYGMSETLQITGNPIGQRRLGSVGCSIGPELAIFDANGLPSPPNTTGIIGVRGPSVMSGYLGDSRDNGESFRDGWYLTGDRGWLDESGYLYLEGRAGEAIDKGGETISPAEIEAVLYEHEAVLEALVVGIPHRKLGQDIVSAVVLHSGRQISQLDFKTFMRSRLSPQKVPSCFVVFARLPRNANGKVLRREVEKLICDRAVALLGGEGGPPQGPVEEWVANYFATALNRVEIGREDDFFALGGTSLDAVSFVSEIEGELQEVVHVTPLLERPTVESFARFLSSHYHRSLSRLLGDSPSPQEFGAKREPLVTADFVRFRASLPRLDRDSYVERQQPLQPVFILCSPRTGSTLLRVILGGHPHIFAPPELRLLSYESIADWKQNLSGPFAFYQEGLMRAMMCAFGVDLQQARISIGQYIQQNKPIGEIYADLLQASDRQTFVDKTPHYALDPNVLHRMEALFDRPKYIHLVRNPQAAISSFIQLRLDQLWMYDRLIPCHQLAELVWTESHINILNFLEGIPKDRHIRLHFEDLVRDPVHTLQHVCGFLNQEFQQEMLAFRENPSQRMTDGIISQTRSIGDPYLLDRADIDATKAFDGFNLSGEPQLCERTRSVTECLGYRLPHGALTHTFSSRLLARQRQLTSSWEGYRPHPKSLLVGRNLPAKLQPPRMFFEPCSPPPLFWCMQGFKELENLADRLGPDWPLWGMRSAHLLSKDPIDLRALARDYAAEIVALQPRRPLVLGGNCQGARIIWEIAQELRRSGYDIALLFLMEVNILQHYPGRVALLYGRDSHLNPLRRSPQIERKWQRFYHHHTVDEIACVHGQFFDRPNIEDLTAKLRKRICEAFAARNEPIDLEYFNSR